MIYVLLTFISPVHKKMHFNEPSTSSTKRVIDAGHQLVFDEAVYV